MIKHEIKEKILALLGFLLFGVTAIMLCLLVFLVFLVIGYGIETVFQLGSDFKNVFAIGMYAIMGFVIPKVGDTR